MSTRMTDSVSPATDYTEIRAYREGVGGPQVDLRVVDAGQRPERPALAQFDRAEFIRAIETELDGTWIDHADLPKATAIGRVPGGHDVRVGSSVHLISGEDTPAHFRELAYSHLALARHLDANPPVDEAAVDALAKVLIEHGEAPIPGTLKPEVLARRLVKAGVRAPETSAP